MLCARYYAAGMNDVARDRSATRWTRAGHPPRRKPGRGPAAASCGGSAAPLRLRDADGRVTADARAARETYGRPRHGNKAASAAAVIAATAPEIHLLHTPARHPSAEPRYHANPHPHATCLPRVPRSAARAATIHVLSRPAAPPGAGSQRHPGARHFARRAFDGCSPPQLGSAPAAIASSSCPIRPGE